MLNIFYFQLKEIVVIVDDILEEFFFLVFYKVFYLVNLVEIDVICFSDFEGLFIEIGFFLIFFKLM